MKKLLAVVAVLVLTASFAFAQVNYCHDEASGKFTFVVEPAIDITLTSGDVDLGPVCPGCSTVFEQFEKCLKWDVTGGETCHFQFTIPTPQWPDEITNEERWYEIAPGTTTPVAYVPGVKLMGDGWELWKCVDAIHATCQAVEDEYEVTYNVEVDYVCQ